MPTSINPLGLMSPPGEERNPLRSMLEFDKRSLPNPLKQFKYERDNPKFFPAEGRIEDHNPLVPTKKIRAAAAASLVRLIASSGEVSSIASRKRLREATIKIESPGGRKETSVARKVIDLEEREVKSPFSVSSGAYKEFLTIGRLKKRRELLNLLIGMHTKSGKSDARFSLMEISNLDLRTQNLLDRFIDKYTSKGKLNIDEMPFSEIKEILASFAKDKKLADSLLSSMSMEDVVSCFKDLGIDIVKATREELISSGIDSLFDAGCTLFASLLHAH